MNRQNLIKRRVDRKLQSGANDRPICLCNFCICIASPEGRSRAVAAKDGNRRAPAQRNK